MTLQRISLISVVVIVAVGPRGPELQPTGIHAQARESISIGLFKVNSRREEARSQRRCGGKSPCEVSEIVIGRPQNTSSLDRAVEAEFRDAVLRWRSSQQHIQFRERSLESVN